MLPEATTSVNADDFIEHKYDYIGKQNAGNHMKILFKT